MNRKSEEIKEKQISEIMLSIENRVRHVYNQGYEQGLEAGREQTMTREEALKLLADARYADDLQGNNDLQTAHIMAMEALEQEPRWIPVSESLPELDEDGYSPYVLISFSNFTLPCIGQLRKADGENHWYEGDDEKALDSFGLHVNAWMPLPKPYEPQESEG